MSKSSNARLGTVLNVLAVLLLAAAVLLAWQRFMQGSSAKTTNNPTVTPIQERMRPSAVEASEVLDITPLPFVTPLPVSYEGVQRKPNFKTIIPSRPRVDVITYTVQRGDNLFGIAEIFGLRPETILWGNFEVLQDNPHLLKPGQVLNILPVDGTYYQWHEGDSLQKIADFFKVDVKAIIDYPGNRFDVSAASTQTVGLKPGDWLIVPGGRRAIKDWGPPAISRKNPATARYYGPGACGAIYEGAIGTGTFIWPTPYHSVSGYGYSEIHRAIDIGGAIGTPIVASDSGVVVYAGWSNYGYGNLIVIDHGNGFQTAYAHLNSLSVGCGQSVFQGGLIGQMGSTGNSTGPHLHFELVYNGAKLNPLDYLP